MPKVIVYHSGYGCDTGCCGHVIELHSEAGAPEEYEYSFDHPAGWGHNGETPREFAERLVRKEFGEEHVADLAWDECEIVDC